MYNVKPKKTWNDKKTSLSLTSFLACGLWNFTLYVSTKCILNTY